MHTHKHSNMMHCGIHMYILSNLLCSVKLVQSYTHATTSQIPWRVQRCPTERHHSYTYLNQRRVYLIENHVPSQSLPQKVYTRDARNKVHMYNIHKPLLRAFWASLVIASASSRMISLKPDLKMVRVLAKLRIAPLTIPIPLSSDALSCVCCE